MALNYYKNELKENAQHLASKGKGILAVDESTKTVAVSYTHLTLPTNREV